MHTQLTLPSGLRVILVPMNHVESVTIMKGFNVGSRHETDEITGAAHFIEHLMFKGTEKRPLPRDIAFELDRIGANYNAFTGKDITAYYIKAAHQHFETITEILSDFTYNATFPAAEIEKERGVVVEEIRMYEDSPMDLIDHVFERKAYEEGSLRRDVLGTEESIQTMSRDQLLAFRDRFYSDDNSALFVVGRIPDNVEEILKKYFIGTTNEYQASKCVYTPYSLEQNEFRSIFQQKEVEQLHLQIGYRCGGYGDEKAFASSILTTHLGGGMSSVLFDELRENKGLCYYVHMYPDLYEDVGNVVIRTGLNTSKAEEAIVTLSHIVERFLEKGMSEQEVHDAQQQILGNLALNLEDTAKVAEMYMKRYVTTGVLLSPEDRIQRLQAVTKDDIMEVAQKAMTQNQLTVASVSSKDVTSILENNLHT